MALLIKNVYVHYAPFYCIYADPCDECAINSFCKPQLDGSVYCVCPIGYNGTNCDNYIGMCMPNPCMNDGECEEDIPGNFTCSCPTPLSGRLCEVDTIDDCDPATNPCANNATCVDRIDGYTCICPDGFTDTNCTFPFDTGVCSRNPCRNGGRCQELSGDNFTCSCPPPLSGRLCEVDTINDCETVLSPCGNNGTCVDVINDYYCICPDGFTDIGCTVVIGICSHNPCMNGGRCQEVSGDNFTCLCPSALSGRLCEVDTINDCETVLSPCGNNGTCVDMINGYYCICPDGFTGLGCTYNFDDCNPNPCMNGGSCEDLINDYICQCASGYGGKNCDLEGLYIILINFTMDRIKCS